MTLRDEVVITLAGNPAPKGSMKCVGRRGRHQLVEDNPKSKGWRKRIADLVRARVKSTAERHQPLGVEVTLTVDRPKSVRTAYAVTRSSYDVDKLARLVLDALQDTDLLPDDAQVVELVARKTYPNGPIPDALPYPGARIRVYPIGDVQEALL